MASLQVLLTKVIYFVWLRHGHNWLRQFSGEGKANLEVLPAFLALSACWEVDTLFWMCVRLYTLILIRHAALTGNRSHWLQIRYYTEIVLSSNRSKLSKNKFKVSVNMSLTVYPIYINMWQLVCCVASNEGINSC